MQSTAASARVHREGDALVFEGPLERATVPALWRTVDGTTAGVRRLDLNAVAAVDSAGLALLAELAAGLPGAAVQGDPPGLAELRGAYRLGPSLDFAG